MAVETRSHFSQYIEPGLFAVAKENFKRYPQVWKELFALRTSKKAIEKAGYISGFGFVPEKPEGTAVQYDARIQGPIKEWVHSTFALGVRITQEAIEDALYGIMTQASKDLTTSFAATMHLKAIRMFMNLENITYHTAGDGKALCVNNHDRLDGGTYSNVMAAADPTEATLEAAIRAFENIVDDRGKRYDQKPQLVWCGPYWEFRFEKLLGSEYEPETANNAINAVRKRRKLKLVVDPEITDKRWGLLGRKDPDVGNIWFDRIKPRISSAYDADTGDRKYIGRMRNSCECNDPRRIFLVPPA